MRTRARTIPIIIGLILILLTLAPYTSLATQAYSEHLFGTKIGGYTTYYETSSDERKSNIALAARALNSLVIDSGEVLSFNAIVGERRAERGFKAANIIVNGEFVEGIGGGVCQVSSTLYNAWLLSGLAVISAQAHSIPVHYIPLSRDAAVSSAIDLTLKNTSRHPVFLDCHTQDNALAISIYGHSDGYEYNISSSTLEELPPPPPEYLYDDTLPLGVNNILRQAKVGYKSRAILTKSRRGIIVSSRRIREDTYAPISAKIKTYGAKSLSRGESTKD